MVTVANPTTSYGTNPGNPEHAALIGGAILILFLDLIATYYSVARWLFLRDTGRKLLHVDRQLSTDDAVLEDLRSYLKS